MACPPTSHAADCTACVCKVVSLFETTCRCDEQHSMTKSAKDSPHQQHVRTYETATDLMPWQQSKHANTQTPNKTAEQRAKQKILKPNTALHKQQWFSMFSATDCLLQRLCAPIAAMIIGCPSAGRHQVASRAAQSWTYRLHAHAYTTAAGGDLCMQQHTKNMHRLHNQCSCDAQYRPCPHTLPWVLAHTGPNAAKLGRRTCLPTKLPSVAEAVRAGQAHSKG